MNRNTVFTRHPSLFYAVLFGGATCFLSQRIGAAPSTETEASHAFLVVKAKVANENANPRITPTTYNNRPAFRLSDGRTEAIIVPSIGRVMSYGFVGGPNQLWSPKEPLNLGGWMSYGGDKNWPAPQSQWPLTTGRGWPPESAWDGLPQRAEILPGARLRTTSPVSKGMLGARIIREYGFNERGEIEINQIAEKLRGGPIMLSIWSITQAQPDAIYLPTNPKSVYKNNFMWMGEARKGASITPLSSSLLRVRPVKIKPGGNYKIGVDAPVSALIAVKGQTAFVLQNTRMGENQFPDGADGAGFPVEIYDSGDADPAKHYIELELLGPLRPARAGSRWQQTMTWSLHYLSSNAADSPQRNAEIVKLMPKAPAAKPK